MFARSEVFAQSEIARAGLPAGPSGNQLDVTNPPLDDEHARPAGATDELVEVNGTFSEALEYLERARGHLYAFHQLMGRSDLLLDDVVEGLRRSGHDGLARKVEDEVLGHNVLFGRWTFQVVEEFDAGHYARFAGIEQLVREQTMAGRRHVLEAEMKRRRRTAGRPGHEATPN